MKIYKNVVEVNVPEEEFKLRKSQNFFFIKRSTEGTRHEAFSVCMCHEENSSS
jgi:hypothetical protein